jgi:hypothetical protein
MNLPGHKFALMFFGSVFVAWLLLMAVLMRNAALPPEASGTMLAVFDPKVSELEALKMIAEADAKILRKSNFDFIYVVQSDEPGLAGKLKKSGALGAYKELPIAPELAGCFAVVDSKISDAIKFAQQH